MPIINRVYPNDKSPFLRVCHTAMSERWFLPQADVFVDDTKTQTARVIMQGDLKYTCCGFKYQLRPDLCCDWISEGALWLNWRHVGGLVADTLVCVTELKCDIFRDTLAEAGGTTFKCLKSFALLFTLHAETAANEDRHITDLPVDKSVIEKFSEMATKFCSRNRPGTKRTPSLGDRATTPGPIGLFSMMRTKSNCSM